MRSPAEIWYQAMLEARPDWAGTIALHHGSLERDVRDWVEAGLRDGKLRAVVCTSSLDLGVDFLPVERVLQIGSPKGVARLLQRAGRSGHRPARPRASPWCRRTRSSWSRPRRRARRRSSAAIEPRPPIESRSTCWCSTSSPCALGGGFVPDELLAEVRTHARVPQADRRASGSGRWTSSCTAARA